MLVRISGVEVSSYLLMLYLGCVAGILAGSVVAGSFGMNEPRFALASVVLLFPAILGSRAWFVIQHAQTFRADPALLWRRREGGMALYGGLVLAISVSVPVLALADLPFWRFWDATAITMLVGLPITRVGCLMNGCCSGRPTESRLGVYLPDHAGVWARRFPTQLFEAAFGLLMLPEALATGPHLRPGELVAAVVALYSAMRIALNPLRDVSHGSPVLRSDVVLPAAVLAAAAATLVLRRLG